ncbi:hypothetical protein NVP1236O_19 [Vibrio phage 1.236.O._10N.261.52.C4]|nr:hypothetical protein NVP1236O_19 [Vibrio phage 1.236.O._10N.261.52.C4]
MAGINISIKDTEQVKTLIELLSSYSDELPDKLVNSLNEFADCSAFELGQEQLIDMGINPSNVKIECDGIEIKSVVSFNKILRRVTCNWVGNGDFHAINDEIVDIYKWPRSLDVIVDGKKLESLGW